MSIDVGSLKAILRLHGELSEKLAKAARDLRRVANVDGER